MLNLDPAKLLIVAVVAVILLGPDRLPQVARQLGRTWRTVNELRHRIETEVRTSIPDLPSTKDVSRIARSPVTLLNHLSTMAADDEHTTTTTPTTPTPTDSPAPLPSGADSGAVPKLGYPIEVVVNDPSLN